jgi:1-acyl-sn-glycerol-3-phosphate acyltransferase
MLDLDFFRNYDARPPGWLPKVGCPLGVALFGIFAIKIEVSGLDQPPATPVIFAANSSHKYDLVPLRWAMMSHQTSIVTVSKGKNYHNKAFGPLVNLLGSLPIISRGYIITLDFIKLHQRRPSEIEYRALREHIDEGVSLPDEPVYRALCHSSRMILGYRFNPDQESYRAALQQLYYQLMCEMIRLARATTAAGHSIHIYPEGTVSSRLARGKIGAIQLALALDLPIIPLGMSGGREIFVGKSLMFRPGKMLVRCGQRWPVPRLGLPESFRPFHPDDERQYRDILQTATDQLMEKINELLEPGYQWSADRRGDGVQGTRRFI